MNKATTAEYNKKYYEAHKQDILKSISQVIKCEACNCDIQKQWKTRHNKTYKHQRNQNKLDDEKDQMKKNEAEEERMKKKLSNILRQMKEISQ